ncbi:MAG: YceI family protein [Myxococcales bacterium]|nr:YceI family protein [Myxococcales bacterium]MCB9523239.1 YceI family protein [Myxococcales bacterium]
MFKRLLGTVLAASFLFAGAAQAADYDVDGAHAFAVFKVMHLGVAPSYGQFVKVGGSLQVDGEELKALAIEIDTASIFSANKKRDDHLKGPDFFDVKQFPKATFKATKIEKAGDKAFKVTGDMTIKGKTQSITLDATMTGAGTDPWGNERVGFEANFKIDRMAFGVDYMPDGLGKQVDFMVALEGIKKK